MQACRATLAVLAGATWLTLTGCAATSIRADIPTGEWSGRGFVAFEDWSDNSANAEERSQHTDYPTRMTIEAVGTGAGRGYEFEIVSRHGGIAGLEDPTELNFALVGEKRISDAAVLYRFDEGTDLKRVTDSKKPDAHSERFCASCTSVDGAIIVQIQYGKNYVDTIRFAGDKVEKSGVFFDEDRGMFHWCETLTRQR